MAVLVQRGNRRSVETYTDLLAIPTGSRKEGLEVVVKNAELDTRTLGGVVVYLWDANKVGTTDEWKIISQENENLIALISEDLLVTNGSVTIASQPANGFLVSAQVYWEENGTKFTEDVITTLANQVVTIDPYYNGKTLNVKYLTNKGGKVYALTEGVGGSSLQTEIIGANVIKTMEVGKRYVVKQGSTLKTPATQAEANDVIEILAYDSNVNNVIVEINTALVTKINSEDYDIQLDTPDFFVKLVYVDSTVGWRLVIS